MDIDEFEEKIAQELGNYREYYEEYNKTLEETLMLVDQLRWKFRNGK